jgi:hypothetical protein
MPGYLPGFRDQILTRGRQGRDVQRLANVARSLRTTRVLVGESTACSEIQKRYAAKHG